MSSVILVNGTAAATLGITGIQIELKSQGVDEATLTVAAAYDAADIFTHGNQIAISVNGTQRFVGRVDRDPRAGDARGEYHTIKLLGPWWFLENKIYRQDWQPEDEEEDPIQTTHVILGMAQAGTRQTVAQVITEAVNFAIAEGAPIQVQTGGIVVATTAPLDEATDITCAEAIHRQLRWTPDAVAWFDYTTTPPSLYIQRRTALTAASLPAATSDTVNVVAVAAEPCYGIQLAGVRLYFNVEGNPFAMTVQEAGTPDSFQALEMTIELAGARQDMTRQKVVVEAMPAATSGAEFIAWWKARVPWLNDVDNLTLANGNWGLDGVPDWNPLTDTKAMLVEGQITDWMKDRQSVKAGECRAYVEATYEAGGTKYEGQVLEVRYTCTNATSKTYTFGTGATPAEDVPASLAANLYAAMSVLHWQGQITTVAEDIEASLMGGKLNLTGGLAAWASMNAMITGCKFDLFTGRRTVGFGPPPCLGARDMLAMVRANRVRTPAGSAESKKSGTAQGGGEVGGVARLSTPLPGTAPTISKLVITKPGTPDKVVSVDPGDASDVTFNVLCVTDYGSSGFALQSIPVMKKGDVLVITGSPSNLSLTDCEA
jgi:hypothetical protein